MVNLISSKARKHLTLLVAKLENTGSQLCKHIVLTVNHCK